MCAKHQTRLDLAPRPLDREAQMNRDCEETPSNQPKKEDLKEKIKIFFSLMNREKKINRGALSSWLGFCETSATCLMSAL